MCVCLSGLPPAFLVSHAGTCLLLLIPSHRAFPTKSDDLPLLGGHRRGQRPPTTTTDTILPGEAALWRMNVMLGKVLGPILAGHVDPGLAHGAWRVMALRIAELGRVEGKGGAVCFWFVGGACVFLWAFHTFPLLPPPCHSHIHANRPDPRLSPPHTQALSYSPSPSSRTSPSSAATTTPPHPPLRALSG